MKYKIIFSKVEYRNIKKKLILCDMGFFFCREEE